MNDWTPRPEPDEPAWPAAAGPSAAAPSPPPAAAPSPWPASAAPTAPAAPAYGAPTGPPPAPTPWAPYPTSPPEPYRVGPPAGSGWPTSPPGVPPIGPGPAPRPFGSAPAPDGPGRARGRILIGVVAVLAVLGLLAGAFVALGSDDDTSAVQPASDPGGTELPATTVTTGSGNPPVAGNGDEPIADVARAVGPSVVLIATDEGEGSGIIYDKSGLIVTNAHVVGTFTTVAVQLADGTVFDDAKVVGTDTVRDVAVVKVPTTKDLPAATFGKTDDVRVGQTAVAIGSPFGLEQTVTAGIVSAVGRVISNQNPVEMIQTDAPINPGNSGGALADKQGRVIGMNTSIRTTGSNSGSVGVGFAVPADTFIAIANRIVKGESLAVAYLGIRGSAPTGGGNGGVVISTVQAGSPAATAGLKPGDVITSLNGTKITTMLGMSARVQLQKPGDVIELTIVRDGSTSKVKITLGTLTR
jgi:putative serine protease PepD